MISSPIPALAPAVLPGVGGPRVGIAGARAGVHLLSVDARLVVRLINEIARAAEPDRSILSLHYQPMLYFLSERRNPTR